MKLSVNKVLRFRIAPSAAKELIDSGEIGEVRMIQARGSWTEFFLKDVVGDDGRIIIPAKLWAMDPAEGSQYLDYGVHCNDIIRWYSGSEAKLVLRALHDLRDAAAARPHGGRHLRDGERRHRDRPDDLRAAGAGHLARPT